MAGVSWIKITTDMFDNRKIKHLRKLTNGDSMVLIWVALLTVAGRCNAGGTLFLTESMPYTGKMLSSELGFKDSLMKNALSTFEQLNMISVNDGFITINGWEEYQNIDGMERIREQGRIRKAKYDSKRKSTHSGNVTYDVTGNVTVTTSNATDKEEEIDLEDNKLKVSICAREETPNSNVDSVDNVDKSGMEKAYREMGKRTASENEIQWALSSTQRKSMILSLFYAQLKREPTERELGDMMEFSCVCRYDLFVAALSRAATYGADNIPAYMKTVLEKWEKNGVKTIYDL